MLSIDFDLLTIFHDFSSEQQDLLRPLFVAMRFPAGEIIFEQGEPAAHLYVVAEGEVVVRYKPDDGPQLTVAHVHPESVVGWSAALGSSSYTSSAVCTTECLTLRINSLDLRCLYEQHPDTGAMLLERLADVLTERLHTTHDQVMALLFHGLHPAVS